MKVSALVSQAFSNIYGETQGFFGHSKKIVKNSTFWSM